MRRTAPLAVTACLAAVLTLAGCQSHTQTCTNGTCRVTVNGAGQTVEVDDHDLSILEIGDDWVRIGVDGRAASTLKAGSRSSLGPVTIAVTSIEGDSVKFTVS
jgi:hypothetical protein